MLVDDQSLIRTGFKMILESEDDIEVVGEAGDGQQAVSMARSVRPDVILMDVQMPRMDGLEATGHITRDSSIPSRIVILTTFERDDYVFEALRSGASGFLLKSSPPEELVHAVRVVAGGEALLAPSVTRKVIERFIGRPAAAATKLSLGSSPNERLRSCSCSPPGKVMPSWLAISSSGRAPSKPTSRTCSPSWDYATVCKPSYSPTRAA